MVKGTKPPRKRPENSQSLERGPENPSKPPRKRHNNKMDNIAYFYQRAVKWFIEEKPLDPRVPRL